MIIILACKISTVRTQTLRRRIEAHGPVWVMRKIIPASDTV